MTRAKVKFTLHKVEDTCTGSGWKTMDKAYCGGIIETYQYRPEQAQGDRTPLGLNHYSRCAECTARLWHERRRKTHERKWQ